MLGEFGLNFFKQKNENVKTLKLRGYFNDDDIINIPSNYPNLRKLTLKSYKNFTSKCLPVIFKNFIELESLTLIAHHICNNEEKNEETYYNIGDLKNLKYLYISGFSRSDLISFDNLTKLKQLREIYLCDYEKVCIFFNFII